MKPLDWDDGRTKVVLVGLTGFGNVALKTLLEMQCNVQCVITRKEAGPFPYYPEKNFGELASELGQIVHINPDLNDPKLIALLESMRPDLILVSTFHKMLPRKLSETAAYAINIHPSLLPKYRGSTPTYWMLRNGENIGGVTAHLVTDKADAGDIVFQEKVRILPEDTDGTLRQRLAEASAEVIKNIIRQVRSGEVKSYAQDENESSYYPKRPAEIAKIAALGQKKGNLHDLIRANLPFPGVEISFLAGEQLARLKVRSCVLKEDGLHLE